LAQNHGFLSCSALWSRRDLAAQRHDQEVHTNIEGNQEADEEDQDFLEEGEDYGMAALRLLLEAAEAADVASIASDAAASTS
jgi:hypothetical protein